MSEATAETVRHEPVDGRPRDISDENVCDGRRLTIRIPPSLAADIETLVEGGRFPNESEVVRAALRQYTPAKSIVSNGNGDGDAEKHVSMEDRDASP